MATSNNSGPATHIATTLANILSALANNGGPTQTHALPGGSPAIDKAPNSACWRQCWTKTSAANPATWTATT